MRILTALLLTAVASMAQSGDGGVEAVLQQLEHAQQIGDFDAFARLWTQEKAPEIEKMRPYLSQRPEVHYRAIKSYARGNRAVLFVEESSNSFLTLKLRKENGQWKIADFEGRDTAPNPNSVYALIPPDPGGFALAGSPWEQVAAGMDAKQAARLGWQMKAIFDDAYLYILIEYNSELPAPGATIDKPPNGWPVLKIDTSTAGEFVLYDAVNVGDQATFDSSGRANSHRPFAAYMIRLERKDREVFSATADMRPSTFLNVSGREYEIRIPLVTMGITDSRATKITVGDAQWPKSVVLSIPVQRFSR